MEELLDERSRAEDILLGSLGYGEEATLISVEQIGDGYSGTATWDDGEEFSFSNEGPLDDLEVWALNILLCSVLTLKAS